MFGEELPPLKPANFFPIGFPCKKLPDGEFPRLGMRNRKKYRLPDAGFLCDEEPFAEICMGWSPDGIELLAHVDQPFEDSRYLDFQNGDSLEFSFDTRDVKTVGFNNRFCHHFVFLPKEVGGVQAREVTRFRTEDSHELCNPFLLRTLTEFSSQSYTVQMFIPSECLNGYDPDQFKKFGFTYRINRPKFVSQHFSVVSDEYRLEFQPSLWASARLEA